MIDQTALIEPKPVRWSNGLTPAVATFRRSLLAGKPRRARRADRATSDYFEIGVTKREMHRL
jgi:hypothetical protein